MVFQVPVGPLLPHHRALVLDRWVEVGGLTGVKPNGILPSPAPGYCFGKVIKATAF